jgi:hypothetical protein
MSNGSKLHQAATKTIIASAIAGALGGISSDAQAWWFFCKQDCEERADQRYNYYATQCEATRQQADRDCNSTYSFGSQEHQDCRADANDAEEECLSSAEDERDHDKSFFCADMYDCSSG